ncbi:hypothetical protein H4R18_005651 [Coemansia javaensis]|uniref:AAA+ ATPase domain-containing protein n=1 Tax=Coemansia javaensis TaxID=2761396 RepID=A0A9W8LF88_9FUNG|nr:hypothetical protein H4R18_005651 [Coemansia javaensis]
MDGAAELPGLEEAYRSLVEVVQYPIQHAEAFRRLNVEAPRGVLLYGPPGVGKTRLVEAVARHAGALLEVVQGPEILGPYPGESEQRLRARFRAAQDGARRQPGRASILFIDEIDSIAPKREAGPLGGGGGGGGAAARLVAQLLTLMDGLESRGRLVVVGATNLPNALDPALRRPGRFDREIRIDVPNQIQRRQILAYYTRRMPLAGRLSLDGLAEVTNGYVGADIAALCREAASHAVIARLGGGGGGREHGVAEADFRAAMARVVPSTKRGLGIDVARTAWADVGGLAGVKLKLQQAAEWPLTRAAAMARLGVRAPRGVLLFGPPGCSKTTLVKVVATQTHATFLSINGAALYSPYVGDAERTLRETFRAARTATPAVVFFDEIEAMVGKRALGGSASAGDSVQDRILSTLLNEMDGIEPADGVLVVGATNRIDMLDAALLRPGRFDRIVYVPPPDAAARREILRIRARAMPLGPDVDIAALADRTHGFSGADMANLSREAALLALRQRIDAQRVDMCHFEAALLAMQPSLTPEMMRYYDDVQRRYA